MKGIIKHDIPDHTQDSHCHFHRFCVGTGCLRHKAHCSVPMPTRQTSKRGVGRAGVHYNTWVETKKTKKVECSSRIQRFSEHKNEGSKKNKQRNHKHNQNYWKALTAACRHKPNVPNQ